MVNFLKKRSSKSSTGTHYSSENIDPLQPSIGTLHSKKKNQVSRKSGSLKNYHVRTESTEEESYSESFSKSFESGNSESWDTESYDTTDSELDESRNGSSGRSKKSEKTRYQLHTVERYEEEKVLKDTHNLACRHLRDGRLVEAKAKFEEILATLVKEFGEKNRRVGAALHNLGIVHLRSGNMTDAIDAIEEAVRIRKSTLGEFHPKVSDSMVELGIVLLSQENFEDSIEIFNEALHIRERQITKVVEGSQDEKQIKQQIAKISNNIGCAYYEWGESHTAKDVFLETLELQKDISGNRRKNRPSVPEMMTMSSIISNIGHVYLENDEWQDALNEFQKALEIQESILNITLASDKDILLATRENLAFAATKYGNFDFAKQIYKEILVIHENSDENEELEEAEVMKKIAYTHIRLYEYDDALELLQEVKDIHPNLRSSTRRKFNRLLAALHYQANKYLAPKEMMVRTLANLGFRSGWNNDVLCRCGGDDGDTGDLDLRVVLPKRPLKGTKMSGHKVSFS